MKREFLIVVVVVALFAAFLPRAESTEQPSPPIASLVTPEPTPRPEITPGSPRVEGLWLGMKLGDAIPILEKKYGSGCVSGSGPTRFVAAGRQSFGFYIDPSSGIRSIHAGKELVIASNPTPLVEGIAWEQAKLILGSPDFQVDIGDRGYVYKRHNLLVGVGDGGTIRSFFLRPWHETVVSLPRSVQCQPFEAEGTAKHSPRSASQQPAALNLSETREKTRAPIR